MGVGRFICVALPFAMTAAALLCLLVATLSNVVGNKDYYVVRLNLTNLQLDPSVAVNLPGFSIPTSIPTGVIPSSVSIPTSVPTNLVKRQNIGWHEASLAAAGQKDVNIPVTPVTGSTGSTGVSITGGNITAAELGLSPIYELGVWGYCTVAANGTRWCSKPQFNWAEVTFNTTNATYIKNPDTGIAVKLPSAVTDAVKAFGDIVKYTEIAFILALLALAIELVVGIFSLCSRIFSCLTYLLNGLATFFVLAAAAMATALAVIVDVAVDSTGKWYGAQAQLDSAFLAVVWLAFVFILGAGLFWLFTVCCCKPEHRRRGGRKDIDGRRGFEESHEKLMSHNNVGAYQPLHAPGEAAVNVYSAGPQYGNPRGPGPRSDLAYEPYSHANV
jgi:hypothetical protein